MSGALSAQPSAAFPPYMAEVVQRAAALLHMHQGRVAAVPFEYWSDGGELELLASLVWERSESAPRVVVHYLRSGDFVCQSLLGDLYSIDPARFAVDGVVAHDEIERTIWQQEQAEAARRKGA